MIPRAVLLERLPGVIALVLAAVMFWFGRDLQPPFSYEPIGPRAFPMLLAGLLAVNGLWMLLPSRRKPKAGQGNGTGNGTGEGQGAKTADENAAEAIIHGRFDEGGDDSPFFGLPVILTLLGVLAYALLFETLGFPIATALMALALGRIYGGTWRSGIIFGVVMGVGLHLLFDRVLDVTLPAGLLSAIL